MLENDPIWAVRYAAVIAISKMGSFSQPHALHRRVQVVSSSMRRGVVKHKDAGAALATMGLVGLKSLMEILSDDTCCAQARASAAYGIGQINHINFHDNQIAKQSVSV